MSTESEDNLVSEVLAENLIYIIYTSGSTGKPKGTMNTHRGVVNRLLWMQDAYQLTTSDRVLQKTPFSFDVSGWEFWWTLMMGACLVVAKPEGHKDTSYLIKLINEQQITTLHFVPSMLQVFLEDIDVESCRSLRQVFCSGEALPVALQEKFFTRLKAALHNLYGPTEAAIDVTFWHCQPGIKLSSVPIGRPVANTQTYILDSHLQPVPVGVTGELYLGGVQLARGYLNRPELTAERFIANPFVEDFQSPCLYKTGDLARYLPDGNIEYLGRLDNQVKIRGFRIELGEIEAALSQHSMVAQTLVMAREDVLGDKRLVAYVVCNLEAVLNSSDLRQFLQDKLPDYMVPNFFIFLDTLPLNPNGKVDRRALPAPDKNSLVYRGKTLVDQDKNSLAVSDTNSLTMEAGFVAPRTPTEEILAGIWSQVFGLDKVSIYDNFFLLGGHSLLATKIISQCRQAFSVEIPLSAILVYPTISQLAEILAKSPRTISHQDVLVLLRAGNGDPPVFLIHDGDGETLLYRSLAHSLKPTIPVYGVQPGSRDELPIPYTRIEDLAAYYIEQIRQVQPQGPYFLGGLCLGGVLAFEMGLQLQKQGQVVEMVALMDIADVEAPRRIGYVTEQRLSRVSTLFKSNAYLKLYEQLGNSLKQISQKAVNLIVYESQKQVEYIRNHIQIRLFSYYLNQNLPLPKFLQNISVRTVLVWAYQHYIPQEKFEGQVLLFRATEKSSIFDGTSIDDTPTIEFVPDPLFGWGNRVTKDVDLHDVPGGHSSMLQYPGVQVVAEKMQGHIDAVQTPHSSMIDLEQTRNWVA